jgi:hypothetical protein
MMAAVPWREPSEAAEWPAAELCEGCGQLHAGPCPAPVAGLPAGLRDDSGALTRAGAVAGDAACFLVARGYLDPDPGEWPDWVLADLAALYQAGPCPGCPGPVNGSTLADHFEARKQQEHRRWQEEHARSVPVWACDCGRPFKILREPPGIGFYEARPDGLMGSWAGYAAPDSRRRKARRSDPCPGCGRGLAETIAGQLDPQQALF